MTLLPIVGRELRVASRQAGTYWGRVFAAGLATLVGGGFLAVWTASANVTGGNMGQILFGIMKWLCFAFVCCTGLFLTSDTLSEEKREGTLGLLFLTDLRGYDVVFGKLVASSLRSFYGLLAFFPILGLTLIAGGVSGMEFWRTILALCNALFFSLAAGVFVSALSRDTIKAVSGVLAISVVALGLPPLLDLWQAGWDWNRFVPKYMYASPAYAFLITAGRGSRVFWEALLLPQATAWLLLGLASFLTPRSWQEKSPVQTKGGKWSPLSWRVASARRRSQSLDRNPMIWLAGRDQWVTRCARAVFLGFGGLSVFLWWRLEANNSFGIFHALQTLLTLTLDLWVAAQATRFLSEAKRNGALELILCTPMSVPQILKGQWQALFRMVWLPILVILLLDGVQQFENWAQWRANTVGVTNPPNFSMEMYQVLSSISGTVMFLTGLLALGWFGMWMGLRTGKTGAALLKTVLFVQVLPWLVLAILQSFLLMASMWANLPYYGSIIVSTLLGIGKDVFFIIYSRRRLHRAFRDQAIQSPHLVRPPALPAALRIEPKLPPVLPA